MAKNARPGEWRPRSNESEELGAPGRDVAHDEKTGMQPGAGTPAPDVLFGKFIRIAHDALKTLPAARRLDLQTREDALQIAALRILRRSPQLISLPDRRLVALVRLVLRRSCSDLLKADRRKRHFEATSHFETNQNLGASAGPTSLVSPLPPPEAMVRDAEEHEHFIRACQHLSSQARTVLGVDIGDTQSLRATATRLGVSLRTAVRLRIAALEMLHAAWLIAGPGRLHSPS